MTHAAEILRVAREAKKLREQGAPHLIATVVRGRGASRQLLGARKLVPDAGPAGARLVTPVVVPLDDEGVDVLLERVRRSAAFDALAFVEESLTAGVPCALATVFESTDPRAPVGSRVGVRSGALARGGAVDDDEPDSWADAPLDDAPLDDVRHSIRSPWVLTTLVAEARAALLAGAREPRVITCADVKALVEVVHPPPRLVLVGSSEGAEVVKALACA